jgi:DNA-binding beta-propeller fold protein YncE
LIVNPDSGLLGWSGAGASGLALLPAALLRLVHPEPELALRLYAAIGSLALIGLFYALCRLRWPPVVCLTATALLAFAPWSIYFGRNGELNAFVAAWAIAAVLALERAMRGGGPGRWLLAGALSTIGLYWHPSAIWLLPALAAPIIWAAVDNRSARPRLIVALCVFLAAGLVVAAPRLPGLLSHSISTAALTVPEGAQPPPAEPLRTRAQQAIRAFFLLDPTVPGEPRYQASGKAPLDGLTGPLLLIGIVLAAWHLPTRVLPVAVFLIPLVGSQLASPRAPSLADAVVALPGLYLLVAAALERLVAVLPYPSITRAAMLVAVPIFALFGWQAYSGWIGSVASAQARQPALDYDEVDDWLGELRTQLGAGQPLVTAQAWRDQHPRLTTGSRVVRRPRGSGPTPAQLQIAQLGLQPVATITGDTGPQAARVAAASDNGTAFVSDASGRVSRVDLDRNTLVPLPRTTPPIEQLSDIAAADGFVYLADAERSVLLKLTPDGQLVATIGGDWGMYRPRGVAIGPDGRIYVADTGRNRIAVGTPDGRLQKSIVPPASFGTFEQPTEVAVDQSGRIYVGLPEIGKVAILDESGQVLGGWSVPKGNTIESSRFAVVADGVIAVTEPAQSKVHLLDADGRELAAADLPGRPLGVAVANGRLIVADAASGRLTVYALNGSS